MDISFYKLHSTGGDYILVSFLHEDSPDSGVLPLLASRICRRRTGVGANGLLVLTTGMEHALKAEFFLPSGEQQALSGDAIACVGRFAFDYGLAENARVSCESDFGVVTTDVIDSVNFRIDLGTPKDISQNAEIDPSSEKNLNRSVSVSGKRFPFTPVRLKNDYAVFSIIERPAAVKRLAADVSTNDAMQTLQPVFMRCISDEEITVYSWSVAGKTPDHAAGAAACVAAGVLNGFCEREVTVRYRSYLLFVQWLEREGRLLVTAPTEYICSGSYYIETDEHED